MNPFAALLAAGAATLVAAAPAPVSWVPDLVHSRVEFTVSHMVVSKVWGHVPIRSLAIVTPSGIAIPERIDAVLDVSHEDTDNHERDTALRSESFFDVARYPTMTFHSTKITSAGADDFLVTGDLTIKNVTKPVSFRGHVEGRIPEGSGTRAGYSAQFRVDRRDFGLLDGTLTPAGVLLVGYDVTIGLTAEATTDDPTERR